MNNREKQYLQHKGRNNVKQALRRDYIQSRDRFDKELKWCEREYRRSVSIEIEEMTTNDPDAFYEKVQNWGPRNRRDIPMETVDSDGRVNTNVHTVHEA